MTWSITDKKILWREIAHKLNVAGVYKSKSTTTTQPGIVWAPYVPSSVTPTIGNFSNPTQTAVGKYLYADSSIRINEKISRFRPLFAGTGDDSEASEG